MISSVDIGSGVGRPTLRRSLIPVVAVLLASLLLPGCKRLRRKPAGESAALPAGADPSARRGPGVNADPRIYTETRSHMGTLFRIVVALRGDAKTEAGRSDLRDSRRRAVEAVRAAFQEVVRLEGLLSSWLPRSLISKINQAAAKRPTKAVKVPQEVFNLIHRSLKLSRASWGAFDITFKPLAKLYRPPGPSTSAKVPTSLEIRRVLPLVGYRHVKLDYDHNTVRLTRAGMAIGLGGIAKGYAVDAAVVVLKSFGLRSFIVDGGGDLYVAGRHPDRPWRVGIKDPRKPSTYFATFAAKNQAVVTSGDYERFFMVEGKRYHHILDPRTGRPAVGLSSVTVVGPKTETADGLATAAFVLGPRRGFELLKSVPSVEALLVTTGGSVLVTPGLQARVKQRPPTAPGK